MHARPLGGLRLAASLTLVAVAVGGCGGHTVTKSDVIARASQICETAASSVREVAPPRGQSTSELARYFAEVTPVVRHEVAQLRALPRPAQDRAILDQYVAAVAQSASTFRALAAAARAGDQAALASAGAALRANPAATLAARYGITRCAGSLGTAAS
jgi:hypothetical protein